MMLSKAEMDEKNKAALLALLSWVGSRKRLADECGVTPQTVYYWINRGRISATCAKIVEAKTDGMFKKEYLRVDVKEWSE